MLPLLRLLAWFTLPWKSCRQSHVCECTGQGGNAAQFFGIVVVGHDAPVQVRCGKWPGRVRPQSGPRYKWTPKT